MNSAAPWGCISNLPETAPSARSRYERRKRGAPENLAAQEDGALRVVGPRDGVVDRVALVVDIDSADAALREREHHHHVVVPALRRLREVPPDEDAPLRPDLEGGSAGRPVGCGRRLPRAEQEGIWSKRRTKRLGGRTRLRRRPSCLVDTQAGTRIAGAPRMPRAGTRGAGLSHARDDSSAAPS